MTTPRRSVGGAARGPITPSPGSSPGVSIPFSESTTVRSLRRMLSDRDARIDAMKRGWAWLNHYERCLLADLDEERRWIRERIKALGKQRKVES